jgi:hypothetical protein
VAERRDEPGRIVTRAVETLRELPAVDSAAVKRIVTAAARTRARDAAPNEDDLLPLAPPRRSYWVPAGIAAAILLTIGAALVVSTVRSDRGPDARRAAAMPVVTVSASREAADALPIPTQFVFDGTARHVVLVGDFNNWDAQATPLEREPGSPLWSVTVPIQRGRHIYAFLVDSVWTVDKRAPVASDPDFGVTGSVILVGRP